MIQSLYLGRVDYAEGLRLQAEAAALVAAGRAQNVLLLLEHPPVLTLGRNANRANILASQDLLRRRGVAVHEINRGGDVTYHGPGQLVGYPIFDLRTLRAASGSRLGPVDFVRRMEEALIRLCGAYGVSAGRICKLTGVWCHLSPSPEFPSHQPPSAGARKIAAIGIHVARGITSHGFAFNVTTDLRDFDLIVPCGIRDHAVTSLEREVAQPAELPGLETIARQTARFFGQVFGEQVQTVESVQALRAQAAPAQPQSAAEDTPLVVPVELERLRGAAERPVKA